MKAKGPIGAGLFIEISPVMLKDQCVIAWRRTPLLLVKNTGTIQMLLLNNSVILVTGFTIQAPDIPIIVVEEEARSVIFALLWQMFPPFLVPYPLAFGDHKENQPSKLIKAS
jgi:hypothetical protein